jgi:hypothetical protein
MKGFNITLQKIAILLAVRKKQADKNEYGEIWKTRAKEIIADPTKQLEDHPIYPNASTDPEVLDVCVKVTEQLSLYRGKNGAFADLCWTQGTAKTQLPGLRASGGTRTAPLLESCRLWQGCWCRHSQHLHPFASGSTRSLDLGWCAGTASISIHLRADQLRVWLCDARATS